jgi:hypothetical protein
LASLVAGCSSVSRFYWVELPGIKTAAEALVERSDADHDFKGKIGS